MRIVMFYHSLLSDWNHGNAHFLRGVVSELRSREHDVCVYEPKEAWSLKNLLAEHGEEPIKRFYAAYPNLESTGYDLKTLDLDEALDKADLVIVHEWNEHELVQRVGKHRLRVGGYRLLFHDTHHRSVSDRSSMAAYDLSNYDGVLAFGNVIRDIYLSEGWTQNAWTWHEAADTRLFHPIEGVEPEGDLVWIGNWGDEERTAELYEFLIEPVKTLNAMGCRAQSEPETASPLPPTTYHLPPIFKARVYGVRYPEEALAKRGAVAPLASLAAAGIEYAGWLPNYEVPTVFSQFKLTIHVPRRPYVKALPGIPTIRVFEALACGIPLISAPWEDVENLFTPGKDFLIAHTGEEMKRLLIELLQDEQRRKEMAHHGHQIILARHTCAHRVDELLNIYAQLEGTQQQKVVTA